MNESRLHHTSDSILTITKFYFVTVFAISTIVATLYNYDILDDVEQMITFFILLPLLIFGFTIYFSLKKLMIEADYWVGRRNESASSLLFGGTKEYYPAFSHALSPFVSLIRIIVYCNALFFVIQAVPFIREAQGWVVIGITAVITAVVVFGILSTIAVVALNSAREKSRDSRRVADIKQIQVALELYFADQAQYPVKGSQKKPFIIDKASSPLSLSSAGFVTRGSLKEGSILYMGEIPINPSPGGIFYEYIGGGNTYSIKFSLVGSVGDIESGMHVAGPDGIE